MNVASPVMLPIPNLLVFYSPIFFLLVYLPLIISLSYSKGHRLCVLSGDTEMEINVC